MRKLWNAALAVFSLAALAACVPYDDGDYAGSGYGNAYAAGYGGGYCDGFGCPDSYWDMPLYYGSIYYGGQWLNGPLYYRNGNGGRQYWVHGGWHDDSWRGARPDWWREGRTGPALGRDFYRSDRFRNEQHANRGDVGRNGGRSGNRDNAAQQQQSSPPAQQTNGGGGRASVGQGFQRSDAGRQDFRNRADVGNRSGDGGGNRGGGGGGGSNAGGSNGGGGGNPGGGGHNNGGGQSNGGQGDGRSR